MLYLLLLSAYDYDYDCDVISLTLIYTTWSRIAGTSRVIFLLLMMEARYLTKQRRTRKRNSIKSNECERWWVIIPKYLPYSRATLIGPPCAKPAEGSSSWKVPFTVLLVLLVIASSRQKAVQASERGPVLGKVHLAKGPISATVPLLSLAVLTILSSSQFNVQKVSRTGIEPVTVWYPVFYLYSQTLCQLSYREDTDEGSSVQNETHLLFGARQPPVIFCMHKMGRQIVWLPFT